MIIVKNKILPFGENSDAMTVWPFIFIKPSTKFTKIIENHERIHGKQQIEVTIVAIILCDLLYFLGCGWWGLLLLPLYYYIYGVAYLVRRIDPKGDEEEDYRNSVFEKEAYDNERNLLYLETRKPFAWVKYL